MLNAVPEMLAGLHFDQVDWASCGSAIRELRAGIGGNAEGSDDLDPVSWHFVMSKGAELVGSLRVLSMARAPLDFERVLRRAIPDQLRPAIGSAGRLAMTDAAPIHALRPFVRFAWEAAAARGKRMDIISASERVGQIYERRFGYCYVDRAAFSHPRTGRPVRLMTYVPSPLGAGIFDGPHIEPLETDGLMAQLRIFCEDLREAVVQRANTP